MVLGLTAGFLLLLGGVLAVLLLRGRGPIRPRPVRLADRVLAANGAARCLAALTTLEQLARRGRPADLHRFWDLIELPLLAALPDCPPDAKTLLVDTLTSCHEVTTNRAYQRRIMDLRRVLLDGFPDQPALRS